MSLNAIDLGFSLHPGIYKIYLEMFFFKIFIFLSNMS
jgi:hypothetical protein